MNLGSFLMLVLMVCAPQEDFSIMLLPDNVWALENCDETTHLVFVADPSLVSPPEVNQPNRQMKLFFSNLIDLFSPLSETTLDRLKVTLVFLNKPPDKPFSRDVFMAHFQTSFDLHQNKTYVKSEIENAIFRPESEVNQTETSQRILETFNATEKLVVVMCASDQTITNSFTTEALKSGLKIHLSSISIKLFLITITNSQVQSLTLTSDIATFKMQDINLNQDFMNTMSVLMCNRCKFGWFPAAVEGLTRIDSTRVSCYKLEQNEKPIPWTDASETCRNNISSELASLETEQELVSLSLALSREAENRNITGDIALYIGLKRLESSLGKRFQWVNNKPLVHTQWADSEPKGGFIRGCVVWQLPNLESKLKSLKVNFTNIDAFSYPQEVKGEWVSSGCGYKRTAMYLCETELVFPLSRASRKVTLTVSKNKSYLKAIERGELGFIPKSKNFMSVTSLLKRWKSDGEIINSYAYVNHSIDNKVSLDRLKLYSCEKDNTELLPFTAVCDYVGDCAFESDERDCRKCNSSERQCRSSKQCFPSKFWCDLYSDCKGKYDEVDCDTCKHRRCQDGRCLPKHWLADGETDCTECGHNETVLETTEQIGPICVFTCNRTTCVEEHMLNNSVIDCQGPEGPIDETLGALERTFCYTNLNNATTGSSNWAPKCVYVKDIYNELLGCRNMRHLTNCENFTCPEGYYKCPHFYCIPAHYVLDGTSDCPHGEDEDSDFGLQCPFYFRCYTANTFRSLRLSCLHPSLVCDGRLDCPEGDDELNCFLTCQEGFQCLAGTVTITDHRKIATNRLAELVNPSTRFLNLSGAELSSVFPSFLLQTSSVTLIDIVLSGSEITSTSITTTMCDLGTVRRMDLSYNKITQITDPSIFSCLTNLQFLNLSHNEGLEFIDGHAFWLPRLKELDLSNTAIKTLPGQSQWPLSNPQLLNLLNTPIEDLKFFPSHTIINKLDIRGTDLDNNLYSDMFKNITITSLLYTDSFKLCCPQLHNPDTKLSVCHSTKDPFSSCFDLMSDPGLRMILWIDGVLAVTGNLAVIVYHVFLDHSIFKMAYGHFVTHLSVSDLFMGFYLLIIAIVDMHYRDVYVWEEWMWRRSSLCKIAGFLSTLSVEVSTMFIFLITLDRLLVIKYPFGQFKIYGKVITLCCAVSWTIGFLIAVFPLLPLVNSRDVYSTNAMCLGLPLTKKLKRGWGFAIGVFIFFNFFMFVLIACGQLAIYRTISSMRMSQSSMMTTTSRRGQDLAVAKNLSLVVITNFLFWCPIGTMGIMAMCGYEIGMEAYAWTAVLILPINSAINPVLYTVPALIRKWGHMVEKVSFSRSKM